jgi:type 1 fimbria pilin
MKTRVNNKMLLTLGVAALLPFGSALAAGTSGGTVNFNGSVVTSACAISANSANIDVNLGEVRTATLAAAGSEASTAKAFSIVLEDCEIADTSASTEENPIPATTVAVTFTGTQTTPMPIAWPSVLTAAAHPRKMSPFVCMTNRGTS